jgi:glycine cleavage system aminomethyltransferase T
VSATFASWLATRSAAQIEFAPGVAMPKSFGDAHREHLATRRAGGLFDFSFMQCVEIEGPRALECVEALQTRRLAALRVGRIAYTLLLRDDASVLNDATVWRLAPDRFWIFTGRRADHPAIANFVAGFDVVVPPMADRAVIAVQGDISRQTIERALPGIDLAALALFRVSASELRGAECRIARLGYSGETGYEIVCRRRGGAALWEALLARARRGPRRMRIRRRRFAAHRSRSHPVHARARCAGYAVRARLRPARGLRRTRFLGARRCERSAGRRRRAALSACLPRRAKPRDGVPARSTRERRA